MLSARLTCQGIVGVGEPNVHHVVFTVTKIHPSKQSQPFCVILK